MDKNIQLQGKIEQILWKHYEPDMSLNMEEIAGEIVTLFASHTQELREAVEGLGHQQEDNTIWCKMDDVLALLITEEK